jgi:hypothetical protein
LAGGVIKQVVETQFTAKGANKVAKDTQKIGKEQTRLAQSSASAGRAFSAQANGLGGLVGAYAGAAANIFAITAAFTALQRAAQTETIVKGTKTLALTIGQSGGEILDNVRQITDAQLSLAETAETVNIALSAGFNSSQIEKLTNISNKASKALGRTLTDAFTRVTRGAAKLEPELLDELGIFTRIDPAVRKYAQQLNISASSLTNFEKRQAFVNAVIEEGERKFSSINTTTPSSQKSIEQLVVALQDLANEFGQILANTLTPLLNFFNKQGNALLLFGVLTKLVFTRLGQEIGSFVSNTSTRFNAWADNQVAKSLEVKDANKLLTQGLKDYQKVQGETFGGNRSFASLAVRREGGQLSRAEISAASSARARFESGGTLSKQQQDADIKALQRVRGSLKENSLQYSQATKIINTYTDAQKQASVRSLAFAKVAGATSAAVRGIGVAISAIAGPLNTLFMLIGAAQLVGSLFDIDILKAVKGLFVDLSQAAENLKIGVTGAVSAIAGGAKELELLLIRAGASDEQLENLNETLKDLSNSGVGVATQAFAGLLGKVPERGKELFKEFADQLGFTGIAFGDLTKEQKRLIGLNIAFRLEQEKANEADSVKLVLLENLITATEKFGTSQKLIGEISRNLNLSSDKTASIFEQISTAAKDGSINITLLGITIDENTNSFKDLGEESSRAVESLILAQNTINTANEAFDNGATSVELLSKQIFGLRDQIQKLTNGDFRGTLQKLIAAGDNEAVKELLRLDAALASLVEKRDDLKILETNFQALQKVFGKNIKAIDEAVARGGITSSGDVSGIREVAQARLKFLRDQTEFGEENAELIATAVSKQKEGLQLNEKEEKLLRGRETAFKAIAGLVEVQAKEVSKLTEQFEKQNSVLEKQLKIIEQQLKKQKKKNENELKSLKESNRIKLLEEEVSKSQLNLSIAEKTAENAAEQLEVQQKITAQKEKQVQIDQKIALLNQETTNLTKNAGAESAINAQKQVIAEMRAFSNLSSGDQIREEQRKLIMMEYQLQLDILDQKRLIALQDFANQKQLLDNQQTALIIENVQKNKQIDKEKELQTTRENILTAQNENEKARIDNEIQKLKDQRALLEFDLEISQFKRDLDDIKIKADEKERNFRIEDLKVQEQIILALFEATGSNSPLVKAIEAFTERSITDTRARKSIDTSGLEATSQAITNNQTSLAAGAQALRDNQTNAQGKKLDAQIKFQEKLIDLTKKKNTLEEELSLLNSESKVNELQGVIDINNSKVQTLTKEKELIDAQIENNEAKYEAEKQSIEDAKNARLTALEREEKEFKRLVDSIVGNINKGVEDALNTVFDNIANNKGLTDGIGEVLRSTFENVRKTILKQTLIEPVQNFISESVGSFFGIGKKGADNASVVTTAAGDALLVSMASGGIDDPSSGVGKLLSGLDEAKQKSGEVATEQKGFFDSILEGFQTAGTGVKDFFGSIFSSLSGMFGGGSGSGGGGIFSMFSGMLGQGGLNFGQLFGGPSNAMLATGAATHSTALAMQQGIPFIPGSDFGSAGMFLASGGLVKRYAGGGNVISQDRVPALLQPGEFVMKRSAVNAMGANNMAMMNATGKSNGNVVVNIKNEGTPQDAQASQPKFDGEKMVIDIVTRDLRNNGPIRKSLRGGST